MAKKTTFKDIDNYISIQTTEVQTLLEQMRNTIKKQLPKPRKSSATICRLSNTTEC